MDTAERSGTTIFMLQEAMNVCHSALNSAKVHEKDRDDGAFLLLSECDFILEVFSAQVDSLVSLFWSPPSTSDGPGVTE